jgi:DNA-binding NtrC family response regulator
MPTILIVDDDAVIRGILFDLLSEKYECNTASVAEEALQYLEVEAYDAVLTDLAMPGLTGVELLRRIQDRGLTTPVIVISGKGGEEDGKLLLHLGAFAYLAKPFDLSEVEGVVARAVAHKPAS